MTYVCQVFKYIEALKGNLYFMSFPSISTGLNLLTLVSAALFIHVEPVMEAVLILTVSIYVALISYDGGL